MAVSEDGKKWLFAQWAASWRTMTSAWGLEGFLSFLNEPDVSERVVNETFRTLEKERQDSQRFDRTRDMPSLLEFKAVYFRISKHQRAVTESKELPDCDYCQSTGRRWMVTATDDRWTNEEVVLAVVKDTAYSPWCMKLVPDGDYLRYDFEAKPVDNDDLRKFCLVSSIPCTCPRGQRVIRWAIEKRPHAKVLTPKKHHAIISAQGVTHTHREAQNICSEYQRLSNHFHGKLDPLTQQPCELNPKRDESFVEMARTILKQSAIWAEERKRKRGRYASKYQVEDSQM